ARRGSHPRAERRSYRRTRDPRRARGARRAVRETPPQEAARRGAVTPGRGGRAGRAWGDSRRAELQFGLRQRMSAHDDDVIGKAYDSRLMKRLLGYLRPYLGQASLALAAIITGSVLELAPPYLARLAIDNYIAHRDVSGLARIAWLYLAVLLASFSLEYLQTWTMQLTGQRIMYDLRMEIYRHLQRLDLRFYDGHLFRRPLNRGQDERAR